MHEKTLFQDFQRASIWVNRKLLSLTLVMASSRKDSSFGILELSLLLSKVHMRCFGGFKEAYTSTFRLRILVYLMII